MTRTLTAPEDVLAVLRCLERAGYPTYIVGGAVRDQLAGKQPHDYDLCTAARPEQIHQVCAGWKTLDTGLKHGTISVMTGQRQLEVTTFRTEGAYTDFRRPDNVVFVDDVEEDLARRDFTINAMAWNPERGLCDPFGGWRDLQQGLLRCVHQPHKRMEEDALRILRALRFVSENGYVMEQRTEAAVHDCAGLLCHISAERVTGELLRILCGAYVGPVLMEYSDIITALLPELRPMVGFSQNNPHHKYDLWEHSVRAVEAVRPDPVLRLTMLFHDVGKSVCYTQDEKGIGHFYGHSIRSVPLTQAALCRLRLDNAMYDDVVYLVRHHDTPLGQTVTTVRRKLAVHGERYFRALLAVHKADCVGQGTSKSNLSQLLESEQLLETVLEEEGRLKRRDLAINGRDLMARGLRGKQIGDALAALLNYVLDDPSRNTAEQLYAQLQRWRAQTNRLEFTVSGMSWKHCAEEVQGILEQIPSARWVYVDLPSGRVEVTGKDLSLDEIRQALADAGYKVAI
ncbi:MAG: cation transporter [Butyricicoccus sp.]